MNDYVVWMDSKNARIFALEPDGIEKSVITKNEHHNPQNKDAKFIDVNVEHYHRDLTKKLKVAEQILLMGPGMAKVAFKAHLVSHEANGLATKVIGVTNFESAEHKTEKQMLAEARKFFDTYKHFGGDNE